MKKNVFGRQFKRDANERKALFKNLLTSLVVNEKIQTTEAKAKAIKGAADKLITKAKKGGREAYRSLEAEVNREAVVKLVEDLAGRFKERNGGYTRIIKSGRRVADNAPLALIEWVEKKVVIETKATKETNTANKKEVKATKATKETKVAEKKVAVKKANVKKVRSAAGRKTG